MGGFAENTSVSVEKTRLELERVLRNYGAMKQGVFYDDIAGLAIVSFEIAIRAAHDPISAPAPKRAVCLRIPLPRLGDRRFLFDERKRTHRPPEKQRTLWEQACRSRWRCILLLVKAKLETVSSGASTLEREFLADLKLADGRTVHEVLERSFRGESAGPLLLPAGEPS